MSTFLYLAIEGRPQGRSGRWRFMQRMPNPGATSEVHGLLGFGPKPDKSVARLELRGLPDGVDDETLAEEAYFMDDAVAETAAGDCVAARFCSTGDATEWVAAGRARLLAADRVTSPDAEGHSWATADELDRLLQSIRGESPVVEALQEILKTMRYLEDADIEVRAVYWFE